MNTNLFKSNKTLFTPHAFYKAHSMQQNLFYPQTQHTEQELSVLLHWTLWSLSSYCKSLNAALSGTKKQNRILFRTCNHVRHCQQMTPKVCRWRPIIWAVCTACSYLMLLAVTLTWLTYANTHFDSTCKRTKIWDGNCNLQMFLGLAPQHVWIFLTASLNHCKTVDFPCILGSIASLLVAVAAHWSSHFKIKALSKKESSHLLGLFFPSMLLFSSEMTCNLKDLFSRSWDYRFHLSSRSLLLPRVIIVLRVFWSTIQLQLELFRQSCCWSYSDISFLIWASLLWRYSQRLFSWL